MKIDKTFIKFILVGVVNTLFGTAIMLVFYNVLHLNYWFSSASNYFFGSILSYFLNKNFTFENKDQSWKIVAKFVVNIVICYVIAYGIAKPLVKYIFSFASKTIQDNCAMLFGVVFFTLINFFGQKYFAFSKKED